MAIFFFVLCFMVIFFKDYMFANSKNSNIKVRAVQTALNLTYVVLSGKVPSVDSVCLCVFPDNARTDSVPKIARTDSVPEIARTDSVQENRSD